MVKRKIGLGIQQEKKVREGTASKWSKLGLVWLETEPHSSRSAEGCKLQPRWTLPQSPPYIIRCRMPASHRRPQSHLLHLWAQFLVLPLLSGLTVGVVFLFRPLHSSWGSLSWKITTQSRGGNTMATRLHKPLKQSQQGFLSIPSEPLKSTLFSWCFKGRSLPYCV